ncbi:hypothetical protein E4S40_03430 [Algoriphagus kandeliae]|uniref:WD40 repeat domain-containing protein n=1 Tax=Algoriphagus kandeliae TaxID=2562278 RepID=A0A4Y9QZT5_9BACT|nr:hypothetical protein [Algoriphagus kandeliae]TFV97707.1 hypothetical protein E4S40_03430 [Algoriphagus kandeliae]
MRKFIFLACVFLAISFTSSFAQTAFDLVVVKTEGKGKNLKIVPGSERLLTDRDAYDNQPSFINEYQMVFSAADEDGNHDIIVYNFESEKFTNLTKTADRSEFSPSITECGQYIAAVVMESDGTQRIWLYPTNFGEPELLYDDIEPVGYYDWYDNKAAMFILGDPNQLVYAQSRGNILMLDENIGRSIKRRPRTDQITYLSQDGPKEFPEGSAFELRAYDMKGKNRSTLGLALPGSGDFIWLDKNTLLMGRGNQVFSRKWNENTWNEIGKISIDSHQNITRMAYSPDLDVLVLVMERINQ